MRYYTLIVVLIVMITIPIGAYLDTILLKRIDFIGYLFVCLIESFIFIIGLLCGRILRDMEMLEK